MVTLSILPKSVWQNWQEDVKQLDGNHMIVFTPELSEDKTTDINQRERREVNIETHYNASFTEQDKFAQAIQSHNEPLTN